jgi:hypothetical protein
VITRRIELILWLSTLPLVLFAGSLAWVPIYGFYLHLQGRGPTSFFIAFHFHFLRLLGITMVLLVLGLLSLVFERRIDETK